MSKHTACISSQCVACSCCVSVCPLGTVTVFNGIKAKVNPDLCIGCGKCMKACPASVITMEPRRNES